MRFNSLPIPLQVFLFFTALFTTTMAVAATIAIFVLPDLTGMTPMEIVFLSGGFAVFLSLGFGGLFAFRAFIAPPDEQLHSLELARSMAFWGSIFGWVTLFNRMLRR
jgi:hypothetical protein